VLAREVRAAAFIDAVRKRPRPPARTATAPGEGTS
jgi:hypothetical protein